MAAILLLAPAPVLPAQRDGLDLTVEAPASLAPLAERVRHLDRQALALALARAGLGVSYAKKKEA